MSDHKMRQRWEARRKMIADDFFAGDEANAETVLDCLPYSTIPDWGDVALLMQNMAAAGLLATPEHDAAGAAKALQDAAADLGRRASDPALIESADRFSGYYAGVRAAMQREIQLICKRADRIEHEGGAS